MLTNLYFVVDDWPLIRLFPGAMEASWWRDRVYPGQPLYLVAASKIVRCGESRPDIKGNQRYQQYSVTPMEEANHGN